MAAQHSARDLELLRRAVDVALRAERRGNVPIGALVVLDDEIIAVGENSIVAPAYVPTRHAEIVALDAVPATAWPRARDMTLYTTLEPCVMCMGTALLAGVGRVVFGAADPEGGAGEILAHHLPRFYDEAAVPTWVGPLLPRECDPLFERALERFTELPCGRPS